MFTDRHTPLNPLARPFAANLEQPFRQTGTRGRKRQAACVQGRKRNLQTLTFLGDHVFARHMDVCEFHDAVVKRAQPHEMTAIRDLESGRIDIDNKRCDLFAFAATDHFRRRAGHHHEDARLDQICAPEFLAIKNER